MNKLQWQATKCKTQKNTQFEYIYIRFQKKQSDINDPYTGTKTMIENQKIDITIN